MNGTGTFQSLLWWINYWRLSRCLHERGEHEVSILVVVDQLLEGKFSRKADYFPTEFQSLLWWINYWRTCAAASLDVESTRFNPCCGGSITGGLCSAHCGASCSCFNPCCGGSITGGFSHASAWSSLRFQSLLWWINYWRSCWSRQQGSDKQFQSLLLWINYWRRVSSPGNQFQSLLWWINYWRKYLHVW